MINSLAERIGVNRTVLALSVARLGDAIGNSILIIVIPLYVAKLPSPWFNLAEPARVGILIAAYGLVNALLQPIMGALVDRLGKRKLLIQVGLVIMALATFSFSFAARFTDLLLLRAVQGIGVAITIPAALALMAVATKKHTRGGSMGVYSASRMLGFAIGPLLGGILFERFGFNTSFYVGAGFIFVGMLMVQVWVREHSAKTQNPTESTPLASEPFRFLDKELFTAGILGAAFASFIMASDFSMISTLETQFNARLNQSATAFGVAFSALMIGRLIFQIPLGRWSDKIGRKPLIIGGLIVMAPVTFFLGTVASTLQFVGLRVIQGIGSAAVAAPAFALAADLSKKGGEGRQMSIITMGFGLGIALGPLMTGFLATQSFLLPFIVSGVITLISAWIVFRYVPETIHPEELELQTIEQEPEKRDQHVQGHLYRESQHSLGDGD